MADPRSLTNIGPELGRGALKDFDNQDEVSNMRVFGEGLRASSPRGSVPPQAEFFFSVHRDGIIHFSDSSVVTSDKGEFFYEPVLSLKNLAAVIKSAQLIFDRVNYWGPVQIVHRLTFDNVVRVGSRMAGFVRHIGAINHVARIEDVNLRQIGKDIAPLLRDFMDQIYQQAGSSRSPYFDETGNIKDQYRSLMD